MWERIKSILFYLILFYPLSLWYYPESLAVKYAGLAYLLSILSSLMTLILAFLLNLANCILFLS